MSLSSSMGKVVGYTNKIIGAMNPQSSGANVSVGSWGKYVGLQDLSFNSLSDTRQSIQEIRGAISQGVTTVMCLKYLVWDNPAELLNFLDQLATGVAGAVGSVIDQIYDAITYQITCAVNQIAGSVMAFIDAIGSLISSIVNLFEVICDTVKSWFDWSNLKLEMELKQENCKDMFAAMIACFLNKYLGKYLDEFAEKAVEKINEGGQKLNDSIYESLQDINTFSSYAKQESFLLKKASIQIKGLSKESLLG